jgi:hypothetical protein
MKIQIKEKTHWQGEVRITAFRDGQVVSITELKNLITDAGLNLLISGLVGEVDAKIKYIALGNDDIAPSNSDTKLGNEFFRKAITKQEDGGTGEIITTTYIAPGEANTYTIKEIGWFAGENATTTKDSGVLIARVLYTRAKNEKESLVIERTDALTRGV